MVSTPVELFYSYAHEDEILRDRLNGHLALLRQQDFIREWYDRDINAGGLWAQEIDSHLKTARVILLLVSPDFIASSYCYGVEMKEAMRRHEAGEATVIPIILRPCDWETAPFGKLRALPKDGKAVTMWANRDAAFLRPFPNYDEVQLVSIIPHRYEFPIHFLSHKRLTVLFTHFITLSQYYSLSALLCMKEMATIPAVVTRSPITSSTLFAS